MNSDTTDWDWSQIRRYCLREARRHVTSHADADDVAQAAVLRAWLRRESLSDVGALWRWLARITHNEAMRLYERRRPEPRAELPECAAVDELAESVAVAIDVTRALGSLSPGDQHVLALHYRRDMTGAATARELRITHATAKVRLHRARARLGRVLQSGGYGP